MESNLKNVLTAVYCRILTLSQMQNSSFLLIADSTEFCYFNMDNAEYVEYIYKKNWQFPHGFCCGMLQKNGEFLGYHRNCQNFCSLQNLAGFFQSS